MSTKTILVAGASSAIAQVTIKQLVNKGHQVVALSRQPLHLPGVESVQVEGYDSAQLPSIVNELDGIVYFPGTINLKPFQRISLQDFKNEMDIHAWGAVNVLQQYISNIPKTKNGAVVLLGSVAAQLGMPYHTSVSMAKGAIHGLTLALAAEWAPRIRVNAVAPSLTDTPMGEKLINTPEKRAFIENKNPMGKIGEVDDIANAVSYLLSDEAKWITGQILSVDGGMGKIKL